MAEYGEASAKPAGRSAPKKGMDDERFKTIARELIRDARDYMDAEPLIDTERAWRYFDGQVDAEPMGFIGKDDAGNSVYEGSRVVVTECRDTLYSMIPELYRIFTASDEAVAFEPMMPEDVEAAEQATMYANHVWSNVNQGEATINTALLDWGIKFAAFKVWWEDTTERESHEFSGLDELAIKALTDDPEIVELDADPEATALPQVMPTPDGGSIAVMAPQVLYSGKLVREVKQGKICIKLIPHEELLLDGDAQCMEEARIVGQDALRTVDEVVAMGIDPELVQQYAEAGTGGSRENEQTTIARTGESRLSSHGGVSDPALAWVRIVEANVRIDRDEDGKPEVYRVIALGSDPEVVDWSEGDDAEYVIGSPLETAHRIIGRGIVETMTDLQDIATSLFRRTLDNLARSINPRAMVSDNDERTWQDVLSWFGGPIRVSRPGAVEWFTVPFTANNAFPLMEYVQGRSAQRSGISLAGQGLDPDVLKGQTLEGVHAMVSAPQSRIEYFARRFALTIMRPIFQAVLRLSVQYQDKPAVVRMSNKWITVDPRGWNASMDATPRVGLGTGTRGEKLVAYQMLLAKQEQLLTQGSPLVTLNEYKNTLVKITELVGERDAGQFFKDLDEQELAAAQQQAQQAAQQQAQQQMQMAAQAQAMIEQAKAQVKAQADVQKAQLEAQADQQKLQLEAQADQQQAAIDAQLKRMEFGMKEQLERLEHALEQQRLDREHDLKILELAMEERLEREKMRNNSAGGQGDMRGPS